MTGFGRELSGGGVGREVEVFVEDDAAVIPSGFATAVMDRTVEVENKHSRRLDTENM